MNVNLKQYMAIQLSHAVMCARMYVCWMIKAIRSSTLVSSTECLTQTKSGQGMHSQVLWCQPHAIKVLG